MGELVCYRGPYRQVAVTVAGGDVVADRGGPPIEVPADVAESLLASASWQRPADADDGADQRAVADLTVDDVLAWVAGDPQRARQAYDAERARGDKARSSLIRALDELIDDEETDDGD